MSQAFSTDTQVETAIIAIGANLPSDFGVPSLTIQKALAHFSDLGLPIISTSKLYVTPCFPVGYGPDYLNAAVLVRAECESSVVLQKLHQIEAQFGRTRDVRWGGRVLDLDLLAMGDLVLPSRAVFETWQGLPRADQVNRTPDQLILPHPRIQDRGFVLVPMLDVAPDWIHPILGLSVRQMHAALPDADLADIVETNWD